MEQITTPTWKEALRYWFLLGCTSFGGPAAQIAMMHEELVEKRKWISAGKFLNALNFCMLLPGPEAQQLAIYLGWRLHGIRGGIAAGALFVIPSVVILFLLSWLYMSAGHITWVASIFHGFAPAVIAIVFSAVWRIGKKTLRTPLLLCLASASFLLVYFHITSFLILMAGAAIIGVIAWRYFPNQVKVKSHHHGDEKSLDNDDSTHMGEVTWQRSAKIAFISILLWSLPMIAAAYYLGGSSHLFAKGIFFSKAALVTFGGAYAVLPYVSEHAVVTHAWLSQSQMMTGLGLAETTPGPLIMVLQFVGFVSGWQHTDGMSTLLAASLGALMTTWVTFLPGFMLVLIGAPYVEKLSKISVISAMLGAITACVVGQIMHLGVTFSQHALWPIGNHGIDYFVAIMAVASFAAMIRFKISPMLVLLACALSGLIF